MTEGTAQRARTWSECVSTTHQFIARSINEFLDWVKRTLWGSYETQSGVAGSGKSEDASDPTSTVNMPKGLHRTNATRRPNMRNTQPASRWPDSGPDTLIPATRRSQESTHADSRDEQYSDADLQIDSSDIAFEGAHEEEEHKPLFPPRPAPLRTSTTVTAPISSASRVSKWLGRRKKGTKEQVTDENMSSRRHQRLSKPKPSSRFSTKNHTRKPKSRSNADVGDVSSDFSLGDLFDGLGSLLQLLG